MRRRREDRYDERHRTGGRRNDRRGAGGGCVVGVSWNNYQEERWAKWDEPATQGCHRGRRRQLRVERRQVLGRDAGQQRREPDRRRAPTCSSILAQDGTAIKPSVADAIANGVPVIAYDRLIEDPGALYITFDNVEVGRMEARAVFAAVPKGNYVIIKGN